MSAAWQRRVAALTLGVTAFTMALSMQKEQGITRDEVVYMHFGERYASWWLGLSDGTQSISAKSITEHFGGQGPTANNREHPPLMKTLFGLSERLFHQRLGWLSRISAFRLPNALLLALLVACVLLFVASIWGLAEGIVAGLLTLLLPRALFHAGLACLDAPIAALWLITLYAYYRALSSRRWCWVLGVCFGLALATKHNALLLPIAIFAHYVGVARHAADVAGKKGLLRALWHKQPMIGLALVVIGPLTLVAIWPWLWFDTFDHVRDWIAFHRHHVHYNFEYLGQNYTQPPFPWHVPLVTTALTTPVATLAGFLIGLVVMLRRRRERAADPHAPGLLLLAGVVAAMAPFVLRTTPIFGAEKHWAPAMPFFCIVAGVGVVWAAKAAVAALPRLQAHAWARRAAITLICSVVVAAALSETLVAHPYALSHYNALAGGPAGGASLGMNRQFWGYAARGVLPWLDARAAALGHKPKRVFTQDASPAWGIYQREGLVSSELQHAGHGLRGIRRSDFALVIHELHFAFHDVMIWREYGTSRPAHVLTTGGVPIVSVYERRPGGAPRRD